MRELDLLLERFLEHAYGTLPDEDKDVLEKLLEHSNEDLRAWLMEGATPPDGDIARVVGAIRHTAP